MSATHLPALDPDCDLSFTRSLAIPRPLVWACWTQAEHIPHFFIPAPHRVTAVTLDLRVGGAFETRFEVDGAQIDNKGVWLEIVPQEKLVFTDSYSVGWKPAAEPFLTAILLLSDTREGGTSYTAIARHRSAEARKSHEDMGFFAGWNMVVDQLEAYAQ